MKFVDLLKKDKKELVDMCLQLKKEFMFLRFRAKTAQDIKTSDIRFCKRNIARIKTRLRQLSID